MRKITDDAARAFHAGKDFKRGNTCVYTRAKSKFANDSGGVCLVLFGHTIAERIGNKLFINSCGHMTNTTKERLNGILMGFGVRIYQRKGEWYILSELMNTPKHWDGNRIQITNNKSIYYAKVY